MVWRTNNELFSITPESFPKGLSCKEQHLQTLWEKDIAYLCSGITSTLIITSASCPFWANTTKHKEISQGRFDGGYKNPAYYLADREKTTTHLIHFSEVEISGPYQVKKAQYPFSNDLHSGLLSNLQIPWCRQFTGRVWRQWTSLFILIDFLPCLFRFTDLVYDLLAICSWVHSSSSYHLSGERNGGKL